jgi:quercetin dioxygenase-like cupin family protein
MLALRILGTTLVLACNVQLTSNAQAAPAQPIVVSVMQKDLADVPGKEMVMLTVDYPPGAVEHVHRHDAYAFVYVLEGTIVEQVRGGKEVTLTPGQTFYEGPNDVHTVGGNASATKPAKFLVVAVQIGRGYPAACLNLAAAASGVTSRWGEPSISNPTMNFRMVAERSSGG